MKYNEDKFAAFSKAYRDGLTKAMKEHPDEYMAGLDAETIADRLLATVRKSGIMAVSVPQSKGFKNACKTLGIKQTYKEIDKYLKS